MQVSSIQIQNVRSLVSSPTIALGNITVLVGPNNAGKSSIIRSLHTIQQSSEFGLADIRDGAAESVISMELTDIYNFETMGQANNTGQGRYTVTFSRAAGSPVRHFVPTHGQGAFSIGELPAREPHHFVVPYLSKRKTAGFAEDVRAENSLAVNSTLHYLAAKLSRIANPQFPGNEIYRDACQNILGFVVTAIPSQNGQQAGVYLPSRSAVPIQQMGEGVPHIVGLLADLALSEGKLFLIEELENDLHPAALKEILKLIVNSSTKNQFVISTHSHIVVTFLAALPTTKVYEVTAKKGELPANATVREVGRTVGERTELLGALGYSLADFDLAEGWLILEEASAERIIRQYLIPMFAPGLGRFRTLSAKGVDRVEPVFEDFRRMTLYAHLEERYRNSTWVRVDNDEAGTRVTAALKRAYAGWDESRFGQFPSDHFERFYPTAFAESVEQTLQITDRAARRDAKADLLDRVLHWLAEDENRAREALAKSAAPVIDQLREIEVIALRRS